MDGTSEGAELASEGGLPGRYPPAVTSAPTTVRIGLLGCGNVGAALVALVEARRSTPWPRRAGVRLEITRIAVRSLARDRGLDLAPDVSTVDAMDVATDPDVDVVVEVIGGIEPARELILPPSRRASRSSPANKELLANHGAELAPPPTRPASTSCSRRPSPAASPSSGRCASRSPARTSAG